MSNRRFTRKQSAIEQLESRWLLVTFTVTGTAGNDTISLDVIAGNVVIMLNGSPQSMSDASVTDIVINGGIGNDTISILRNSNNPTTINGGNDSDTVSIGSVGLAQIGAPVIVNGDANIGSDSLSVVDAGAVGSTFTLTSTTIARTGVPTITYNTIERVTLSGSSGDDTINLISASSAVPTTVNGGNGDDTFNLGNASSQLDQLDAAISINAQGDSDVINFNDRGHVSASGFTVTLSSVTRTGIGVVSYFNAESVVLNAGNVSPSKVHRIESTLSTTAVTLNSGGASDAILVAPTDMTLSNIDGALTVNGEVGTDNLLLFDNNNATGVSYTITSTAINRTGMATITYGTIEAMTLNAGSAGDNVNIDSTAVLSAPLVINGNDGADVFDVGGGNLEANIRADLTLNAGDVDALTDTLTIDDALGPTTRVPLYSLNSAGFAKNTLDPVIFFDEFEGITFAASNTNNTIAIDNLAAGTPVTVNGGSAADRLNLTDSGDDLSSIASAITFNGNLGSDVADLSDTQQATNRFFTITSTQVTRGSFGGLTYATIESLVLAAGAGVDNILVRSSAGASMLLNGGPSGDTFDIRSVQNTVASIQAPISLAGGLGNDSIEYIDSGHSVGSTYTFTEGTLQRNGTAMVSYNAEVEAINILCSTGGDNLHVESTGPGTTMDIQTIGLNDNTFVAGATQDLDAVRGQLTGIFRNVILDDSKHVGARSFAKPATGSTTISPVGLFAGFEGFVVNLTIEAGPANDSLRVDNLHADTHIFFNGNGGEDSMIVGGLGHIGSFIGGSTTFNGGADTDSLVINDDGGGGNTVVYTVTSTFTDHTHVQGQFNYADIESYRLEAGILGETVNVLSTLPIPFVIHGNAGADTIAVHDTAVGSFVTIDGGAGLENVTVNSDGVGTARAHFPTAQDLATFNVLDGALVEVLAGGDKLLQTNALNFGGAGTGVLDLAHNDMIVNYPSVSVLAAVQAKINSARNGGTWDGAGITSSAAKNATPRNTALGAMESLEFKSIYGPGALFNGVPIDDSAVLVKYTYYGDADFNGQVNFDDYSRTDAGFNFGRTGWINGDFDGNGIVNFDDYSLIDLAFNTQGNALRGGKMPR